MDAPDLRRLLRLQFPSCFAEQGVDEQAAAHADATVDAPHGELDPHALERLAPGEHVLVHAVDQRAVEIKKEGGTRWHGRRRRATLPCYAVARRLGATPLLQ